MKWISVKDRLPRTSVDILIASTDEAGNFYYTIGYHTEEEGWEWVSWADGLPVEDVTHWAPLEPPGGTNHE